MQALDGAERPEWPPSCSLCRRRESAWELDIPSADPAEEGAEEVLMTLANGYLATRGASPEGSPTGRDYPGTYVAGVYNRLTSVIGGRGRVDESIVNLPDWLPLWIHPVAPNTSATPALRVIHDHRVLDMRRGLLLREMLVEGAAGYRAHVHQERFVSMRHPHRAHLRTVLTPVEWAGRLRIVSAIHGSVINDNVATFSALRKRHLRMRERGQEDGTSWVAVETTQSRVRVAVATRTRVAGTGDPVAIDRPGWSGSTWEVPAGAGRPLVIEKTAAVFTGRDAAISEPLTAARRELEAADAFPRSLAEHVGEWRDVSRHMRLRVELTRDHREDKTPTLRAIRLHLFHVAQTLSRHSADADVGVPARGLHGEAYRGHVFWDELFVFPLLNLRMPELTRALLMYRYRRLPEARRLARSVGCEGALFPWQSGSDGREETPAAFFNPRSGAWMTDNSRRQHHVNLAVGYNVWQYFQVTGDRNFLASYGAEILVEIARFWASRAEEDVESGRFHLRGMMGPDEFHDGYPGRPGEGVDDNAYIAVMTSWLLDAVLRAHAVLGGPDDDQWRHLGVTPKELRHWRVLSRNLTVPFLDNGLLAQFDGYQDLEEIDLDGLRERFGDIGRLDLILQAEGDSTNRYKASKQADVLMLFYLLSAEEIGDVMTRLGYDFDPRSIPATIDYYLARTTHGSTLSKVVHAWILARGDRRASWHLLRDALRADLADTQRGTTREGIHLGAMAATIDILQRGYTGLQVRDDVLYLHPQLPEAIARLTSHLRYRGHWLELVVTHTWLELRTRAVASDPITVEIDGRRHVVASGDVLRVPRGARGSGPAPLT